MVGLSLLLGLLLVVGNQSSPHVREFSWRGKQIGAEDTAFTLTFSRPMNHASVEQNLRIEPTVAGKFSWAGRRMAYTLVAPAPYGTQFQLQLQGAYDRFSQAGDAAVQLKSFVSTFRSRDRAFVYLGAEGEEAGRLILYNLTRQEKHILTPADWVVMDYKPYPKGDRILFAAMQRTSQAQSLLNQNLYTVTTGLATDDRDQVSSKPVSPPGVGMVELVLDSEAYQNLKFDLAADGQTIIVQRANRTNPTDFGLWVIKSGEAPQQLKTEPGGDFLITPDSQAIALAQGQGMAILPLNSEADPLDYLPKFGMALSFAKDGSAAAMVKFNEDPANPTRSLFLVSNQGVERELLRTSGSILSAQFDPTNQILYCLITQRLPGEVYVEQPYLTAIQLKTGKRVDLLKLPIQQDIQMSLAADGLAILVDQVVSDPARPANSLQGSAGEAIATSRLWFLPLIPDQDGVPTPVKPEALPLPGLRPRWLP
jgi:hypothetical protein